MPQFRMVLAGVCLLILNGPYWPQDYAFEFLGEHRIETGTTFENFVIGGLSGLTYDAGQDLYYSISDDYSNVDLTRFFVFKIDLNEGRLNGVSPVGVRVLLNKQGNPFAKGNADSEGIVYTKKGLFISSEGHFTDTDIKPFIRLFDFTGKYISELRIPDRFLPTPNRDFGVAKNRAFESLDISPDGKFLFTANEEALSQDGPQATTELPSPVRLLKYDLAKGIFIAEYLYWVEKAVRAAETPDGSVTSGLVDLIALSESKLLALERCYSPGVGTDIRIFAVDLSAAQDISALDRLDDQDTSAIQPAEKRQIFDLSKYDVGRDNTEGLTFGPRLPDGRRSLILVSDNNFNEEQVTQFLTFAVASSDETYSNLAIAQIQGSSHSSPFSYCTVTGVKGIVTAQSIDSRSPGFWLQSQRADDNDATSEGLFVSLDNNNVLPDIGDEVSVSGKVTEQGRRQDLTRTTVLCQQFEVVSKDNALPDAIIIGQAGRLQPSEIIEDDNFTRFEPENDGIDFYESLEGMRVSVNRALVTGVRNRFGESVVLPDSGESAGLRTSRGGILLREHDFNPERLFIRASNDVAASAMDVGTHFTGEVTGVMDYSFGNYKLFTTTLPTCVPSLLVPEKAQQPDSEEWLTVATYNVENLDFLDPEPRFKKLAMDVVQQLQSPDILALQEIQDDTGPNDDGTVAAEQTVGRLAKSIQAAGGPAYQFVQIDPENNTNGGQRGGNIRTAFLYNPDRVQFAARGNAGPWDAAAIGKKGNLVLNPGTISPKEKAFENSRKPLVAEFAFKGRQLIIINCHLNSKGGDDAFFGAAQPPVFHSEKQRLQQANLIQEFVSAVSKLDSSVNIILLGDMNDLEFRKPMQLLDSGPLKNLTLAITEQDRYTYIYQGNSQLLDHIFASRRLAEKGLFEIDIVHINAEFDRSKRASDHDPVVARFRLK